MEFFQKPNPSCWTKILGQNILTPVALRGSIKSFENNDISLYLGSNFHFLIYPVNQNKEFNFISIIKKDLHEDQINNQNYFKENSFIKKLIDEISLKTSIKLENKVKNLKSFPIFVSNSFNKPDTRNVFLVGDALYAFPPSFAQGASQSMNLQKKHMTKLKTIQKVITLKDMKKLKGKFQINA